MSLAFTVIHSWWSWLTMLTGICQLCSFGTGLQNFVMQNRTSQPNRIDLPVADVRDRRRRLLGSRSTRSWDLIYAAINMAC